MTDEKFEQGFNDSELEEIMEEIESLEEDAILEDSGPEEVVVESKHEDSQEAEVVAEPVQEEVIVESAQEDPPSEEVSNVASLSKDHHQSTSSAPASTSMDFSVNGEMSLNMGFHINGQRIDLTIDANHGFVIDLPGGARFNVPLSQGDLKKNDKAS